jgi:hypothetical protein
VEVAADDVLERPERVVGVLPGAISTAVPLRPLEAYADPVESATRRATPASIPASLNRIVRNHRHET